MTLLMSTSEITKIKIRCCGSKKKIFLPIKKCPRSLINSIDSISIQLFKCLQKNSIKQQVSYIDPVLTLVSSPQATIQGNYTCFFQV